MVRHLGLQNLVQDAFHQFLETVSLIGQKVWQMIGIHGNVEVGHRFLRLENRLFAQRPFSGRSLAFSISGQQNLHIWTQP
jgi:hypothetical protein